MKIAYPLRVFFDCSTAHLSRETHRWLDAHAVEAATRRLSPINAPSATPFGWFVYAAEPPFHDEPADLVAVMRLARGRGAEFILFDSDAPENPALPVLDAAG